MCAYCIPPYITATLFHLCSHVLTGLTETQVLDVYPLIMSISQPSVREDISHVALYSYSEVPSALQQTELKGNVKSTSGYIVYTTPSSLLLITS